MILFTNMDYEKYSVPYCSTMQFEESPTFWRNNIYILRVEEEAKQETAGFAH
jgi:hypothetical protein